MSGGPVPAIQRHLARGSTAAAARRANQRMVANTNNFSSKSDVINPAGVSAFDGVQVVKSAPVAFGGTSYTIAWDSAVFDTSSFWSSGSPTLLTIATAGYYQIDLTVSLINLQAANTYLVTILKNGGSGSTIGIGGVVATQTIVNSPVLSLAAGDTISAAVTILTGSYVGEEIYSAYMQAHLLGI